MIAKMNKTILIGISTLLLIPLALAIQSTINMFGGDTSQVIIIDNCSRINITVTGLLTIDTGEYWFHNCTQTTSNNWNCTCQNNKFNLVISTLPNAINIYNITTNVFTKSSCSRHNITYYCDRDRDGYRSKKPSGVCNTKGCIPRGCTYKPGNDCNDYNKWINPGAKEVCNGKDDDCDGKIDEGGVCWSAEKSCNNVILSKRDFRGMIRCVTFDWKNNEERLYPHDCSIKYVNRSPVCVATRWAN